MERIVACDCNGFVAGVFSALLAPMTRVAKVLTIRCFQNFNFTHIWCVKISVTYGRGAFGKVEFSWFHNMDFMISEHDVMNFHDVMTWFFLVHIYYISVSVSF